MKNNHHSQPEIINKPRRRLPSIKTLLFLLFMSIGSLCLVSMLFHHWKSSTSCNAAAIHPEEIKGEVITLKRLREKYFIDYHNMFSAIVRKNLEFPESITLDYTIRFLKSEMKKDAQGDTLWYCIFDKAEDKLIGYVEIRELTDYDPGQLGCWLNEKYWGHGRIQEALTLINDLYFKLRSHTSYIAHVRLWNKRSYAALKKFGLKDKGFFYENGVPARYILEMKKK